MIRLQEKNINTPEEYGRIFEVRKEKETDEFDLRRWSELFSKYKGGMLLDLGCLDSGIVELIPDKSKYFGLDISPLPIKEMGSKYPSATFVIGDLYDISLGQDLMDYVVIGEVLEHLEKPEEAIKEAARVLKSGGILAVSVPLEEAKEPGAVDGERHLWSFSEEDIKNLLSPYGEVEIKILRSIKEPVYKYCWPQLIAWCKKG